MAPKKRSFDVKFKLNVLNYAAEHSGEAAARKFGVDARRIREWKQNKNKLVEASESLVNKNRKKMKGGGRKRISKDLEDHLMDWILNHREQRLRVTRKMIKRKAIEIFETVEDKTIQEFSASNGWLEKFMKRYGLSLRRKTTEAQKDPEKLCEKLVSFVLYVKNKITSKSIKEANIIAADETAVYFDMTSSTTVEVTGSRSVALKTTGHEKAHLTVILAAKGDGTKLKPYVVFKGAIREVKAMQDIPGVVIASSVNGWINDALSIDWLRRVIGKFSFVNRLLVWDSYKCHISNSTKEEIKAGYKMDVAIIPGGCTKYIQAPDVAWNKPFKDRLRQLYDEWISVDTNMEYTAAGNVKAPARRVIVSWVKDAWQSLNEDLIKRSFKSCALTISPDGTEDEMIHCFKEGQPCHRGKGLLVAARNNDKEIENEEEFDVSEDGDESELESNEACIDSDGDYSDEF